MAFLFLANYNLCKSTNCINYLIKKYKFYINWLLPICVFGYIILQVIVVSLIVLMSFKEPTIMKGKIIGLGERNGGEEA